LWLVFPPLSTFVNVASRGQCMVFFFKMQLHNLVIKKCIFSTFFCLFK
jgi:hypothetical protein